MSSINGPKDGEGGETPRFRFAEGATIVGGGPFAGALEEALAIAPRLVCADGAADRVGDRPPDAVIGDLDSISDADAWRARIGERLVGLAEQDTTDLEKCLALVDAPFLVGVGFLGGRIDHELAALHALVADPRPMALIGEADVAVAPTRALSLELEPGDRLSIFPLRAVTILAGAGLVWPVDDLALEAGRRVGTSNEATGDGRIELRFDRPGAVVLVPRRRFPAVAAALRAVSAAGAKG